MRKDKLIAATWWGPSYLRSLWLSCHRLFDNANETSFIFQTALGFYLRSCNLSINTLYAVLHKIIVLNKYQNLFVISVIPFRILLVASCGQYIFADHDPLLRLQKYFFTKTKYKNSLPHLTSFYHIQKVPRFYHSYCKIVAN